MGVPYNGSNMAQHPQYITVYKLASPSLIAACVYTHLLQVGYMGVPYNGNNMAQHPQYITVRNARGREMLDCLGAELQRMPAVSKGDSRPLVMQVGLVGYPRNSTQVVGSGVNSCFLSCFLSCPVVADCHF
jgi:hypothetical protein